jgi:hypothetical protein
MTVYFIAAESLPGQIKIGHTSRVVERSSTIAQQVGKLTLLATMPGDASHERLIHSMFFSARQEGEWFSSTPDLRAFIDTNGTPDGRTFEPRQKGWRATSLGERYGVDQAFACMLMARCLDKYPASVPRMKAQEKVYLQLSERNQAWSRRRVRAIFERKGLRVDLSEIVDMLVLLEIPEAIWGRTIREAFSEIETLARLEAAE